MDGTGRERKDRMLLPRLTFNRDPFLPFFVAPRSAISCSSFTVIHGSLEGVGGVLTSELCHSKADILVITKTQLFGNLSTPFFKKLYFVKFVTFPTLLALLATAWQKHGQNAC